MYSICTYEHKLYIMYVQISLYENIYIYIVFTVQCTYIHTLNTVMYGMSRLYKENFRPGF